MIERLRRSDAGLSLVECLVTVVLLGLGVVAIVGALGTAAATSGVQGRQSEADLALRNAAELVKSQAYVACPVVPSYDVSAATGSAELTIAVASVEHWNGSAFQASCPVVDGGFQKVVLEATASGNFVRDLEIVKRRP